MKRRFSKLAIAAILCTAFVFVYSAGALAAVVLTPDEEGTTPTVTLTATSSNAAFSFNRESDNLFDSFDGVMPGDTLTQTIRVQTASGNPNRYRIYLYARENTESQNTENFLDSMTLTVTDPDNTELKVMEAGSGTAGVLLGTFSANQTRDLTVTLTAPITMGNEFQGAHSFVDWMFYAEQVTGGGGGGGGGGSSDDGDDDVIITEPEVPGGTIELPEEPEVTVPETEVPAGLPEINVEEEAVPLASIPKTGDNSQLLLFIVLMVASGTGLTALLVTGKRPEKK
ncbi:MAG: sortase B protein-sorting domain-containing protein [Intestinibacillus sp.]